MEVGSVMSLTAIAILDRKQFQIVYNFQAMDNAKTSHRMAKCNPRIV